MTATGPDGAGTPRTTRVPFVRALADELRPAMPVWVTLVAVALVVSVLVHVELLRDKASIMGFLVVPLFLGVFPAHFLAVTEANRLSGVSTRRMSFGSWLWSKVLRATPRPVRIGAWVVFAYAVVGIWSGVLGLRWTESIDPGVREGDLRFLYFSFGPLAFYAMDLSILVSAARIPPEARDDAPAADAGP